MGRDGIGVVEKKVRDFTEEKGINLKDLNIDGVNSIRRKFGFNTRGDVLAVLGQNKKESGFLYEVYAADFYDRTLWLQKDRPEYGDRSSLCCLLYDNIEKLGNMSLGFIALGLKYGGKISEENHKTWHTHIHAANYAMKMQDVFSKEIKRVYRRMPVREKRVPEKRVRGNLSRRINHDKFTRLDNPSKTISDEYLRLSLRYAMMFYGNKIIEDIEG